MAEQGYSTGSGGPLIKTSDSSSVSPRRLAGPQVTELRQEYWPHLTNTRKAATDVREFLAGRKGVVLPETAVQAGANEWISDIPHKRTVPQRVRQKLIAELYDLKRPQTSAGPRAASVTTRIEQPLNAVMRDEQAGFPKEDAYDLLLLEGLAFSTVSLVPDRWGKAPTLYDGKGEVARRFRYDGKDRWEGDEGFEGTDLARAKKAHGAEYEGHLARHLPFRQRAYSVRSCAPIFGAGLELEGLIIETHWTASALLRSGITVTSDKDGMQMYPLGAIGEGDSGSAGGGGQITVTEAWLLDEEGLPYVSLCVDGKYTWREKHGSREPHIIDISKLKGDGGKDIPCYGRLPISWGWGLGWSAADLDDRAMSFIAPFMTGWRNIDSMLTQVVAWTQWRGMPALIEKVPLGLPDDESMDGAEDQTPDFQPFKITKVRGDIQEIATQGPAPVVMQAIDFILGSNSSQEPGNSDPSQSAIGQSMAEAFGQDSMTTIRRSWQKMYEQNGSYVLEGAKAWGEAYEPIRVYDIADVLLEQDDPSPTMQVLQLEPDLIGDSFDVRAVKRKVPGENPAVRQQNAELVERRLMTKRKFLEEDGDVSPEATLREIEYEDLLDSDEGKAFTLKLLEQYVGDEFLKQIRESISRGQANPQNGLPVGLAQGVMPPPEMLQGAVGVPEGGDMTGLGVPNPAAASLAGAVAGGMQTGPLNNIARAGGVMPQAPLPGIGG